MTDQTRTLMDEAQAAIGGFMWLGNNLHNIKRSPDEFERLYRVALADAIPVYERIEALIGRASRDDTE